VNLVPTVPGTTPSYWCTWCVQGFDVEKWDKDVQPEAENNLHGQDNLTEKQVFVDPGWATRFMAAARADLYLLFDLGWDVPIKTAILPEQWRLGSLEVDQERFPSCTGTAVERLCRLQEMVRAAGWRGTGLWVAANAFGDGRDGKFFSAAEQEAYWRERARWCAAAGIAYWKVDFGLRAGDLAFRNLLTRVAEEEAPDLCVEQAVNIGPLNDIEAPYNDFFSTGQGRYKTWANGAVLAKAAALLPHSHTFRSYDTSAQLSIATTLDRITELLRSATQSQASALLNCEDEVYLGAALGCAIGVMRHPRWRACEGVDLDPWRVHRRMDEVTRAVRWQRLAPAFASGMVPVELSEKLLRDVWYFKPGDTWANWVTGREIVQQAPAITARGLPLPTVHVEEGPEPFVVAARHPNGAVSVATLPRIATERGYIEPLADVTVEIGAGNAPVGIFGVYNTLTLRLSEPLGSRRIWAQDLKGSTASDISSRVIRDPMAITLSGDLLREVGLSAADAGDLSHPGLVLAIRNY